jgi:hypothetical protein
MAPVRHAKRTYGTTGQHGIPSPERINGFRGKDFAKWQSISVALHSAARERRDAVLYLK